MGFSAVISAARRRSPVVGSILWAGEGPGTIVPVSDTAVTINGTGSAPTIAKRFLPTTVGRQYTVTWQSSSDTGAWRVTGPAIKWQQPTLTNPITIDLNTEPATKTTWVLDDTRDYIFLPKSTPYTNDKLQTNGGRHIVLIGGTFKPNNSSSLVGTLNFTQNRGTVYVEGVLIDHADLPGAQEKDGICYYHAADLVESPGIGDIVVQNTRIANIKGTFAAGHGDGFQPQGKVNAVKFYNVSITTSYCGFQLEPRQDKGFDIQSIELERCEVIKLPVGDASQWLYYFTETATPVFPIKLTDCYVTETAALPAEQYFLYPPSSVPNGAVRTGDFISWPNKPYAGGITVGTPNFVPASLVGIGYDREKLAAISEPVGFVLGANTAVFTAMATTTTFMFQRTTAGRVDLTDFAVALPNLINPASWTVVSGVTTNSTTGTITINAAGTSISARQGITTVVGRTYRLSWTISGLCAYALIGTTTTGSDIKPLTTCDGAGDYTYEFTATTTTSYIRFQRSTAGVSTVSNIVLQEVIAAPASQSRFTTEFTTEFL